MITGTLELEDCMIRVFRHLTGFFRKHGRISESKRALEGSSESSTNLREINPRHVSTASEYFYAVFANEFSCLVPGHPSRRHPRSK
jgi:hypothetical protein